MDGDEQPYAHYEVCVRMMPSEGARWHYDYVPQRVEAHSVREALVRVAARPMSEWTGNEADWNA